MLAWLELGWLGLAWLWVRLAWVGVAGFGLVRLFSSPLKFAAERSVEGPGKGVGGRVNPSPEGM